MFNIDRKNLTFGGYLKVHRALNRAFNISMSLFFIVVTFPLFLLIAIIIKIQDGNEIFYRGTRLGMHKEPYIMYKFRTLQPDAEKIIGHEALSPRHGLVTPLGKFLRDTRLDELPQLFNILRGDMDFVGPRPERPVVYDKICKNIKDYDLRFAVRPGLVGYSQLFTPHGTPKTFRTLIDNRFMKKSQSFPGEISILAYTAIVLARTLFGRLGKVFSALAKIITRTYQEKRVLERISPKNARALIANMPVNDEQKNYIEAVLLDINEEYFLINSAEQISGDSLNILLRINREDGLLRKRPKIKSARCIGSVFLRKENHADSEAQPYTYNYVIRYKPVSPLNYYLTHQYFLEESVAY